MNKLLTIAADRLAGGDDASADRARHRRALGVVNATVGTENDVLTGLHSCPAERAGGKFRCHCGPLRRGITTTPPIVIPTLDTSSRGQREAWQRGRLVLAFQLVP